MNAADGAHRLVYLLGRDVGGEMEYWRGTVNERGFPRTSPFKCDAFHFTSARAAYEAAATHQALQYSNEWKAVPRCKALF